MKGRLSSQSLGHAIVRGLCGRCPACGKGRLIFGYIRPATRCAHCGEALGAYQSADFAPYIVTFVVGMIYTPLVLLLSMRDGGGAIEVALVLMAAVLTALVLLPRVKGAVIGFLWSLRIGNA